MRLTSNLREYIKALCYDKEEINTLLADIAQFDYQMVDVLPDSGRKGTIYLLRNENAGDTGNLYDGYLWIGSSWELIGPRVDLSDYYTTGEVDGLLEGKVAFSDVATTSKNGAMSSTDKSKLDGVDTGADKTVVSPVSTVDGKRVKIATVNGSDLYVPVDDSLDDNSTNPVQNKVVDGALSTIQTNLNGKADSNHTHTKADITNLTAVTALNSGLMTPAMLEQLNNATGGGSSSGGVDLSVLNSIVNGGCFVAVGGSDETGTGTFTNPVATITKALTLIESGGTILLCNGIYNNFAEVEINKSCTIIGLGEVVLNANNANSHLGSYTPNIDIILKGIEFKNGYSKYGGGSINTANFRNIYICDCIFSNNHSDAYGGAIYNNKNTTISNCRFIGNTATLSGKSIYNDSSAPIKLYNNIITGDGVQIFGAIPTRKGNIVNGVADYETVATIDNDGLMSKEDKQKLDSLSSVMLSMELEDNTTLNYESED